MSGLWQQCNCVDIAGKTGIMLGVKAILFFPILLLAACATQPPVQEMSDARSAISIAQGLPGEQKRADHYLKSAETALDDAAKAIEAEHYERARTKALEAKRSAQEAARIKQNTHP